jgi:hypothetical protein
MRLIKPILLAVMATAFATYAFDCLAMSTPDAAMQCCNTMPCSPHSYDHSQECCKTMPSMHSVFVQPASAHALSLSTIFITVLPGFNVSPSQVLDSRSNVLRAQCHAPPIPQAVAPSPLRI